MIENFRPDAMGRHHVQNIKFWKWCHLYFSIKGSGSGSVMIYIFQLEGMDKNLVVYIFLGGFSKRPF